MPPKKKKGGTKEKAKVKKVVEDKTFGMKNKNKSKKAQQYIKQVEQQARQGSKSHRQIQLEEQAAMMKNRKQLKREKEEANSMLFKTVVPKARQTMAAGADPKSVLCAYFKAGKCKNGKKCKFSHDLTLDRKTSKMNVYADPRAADTMDKWDQSKLEDVVKQKQGTLPPTDIICKYFIKAIEDKKYGWLWQCPNGVKCHYRHALPPGYVLKKDEVKTEDDGDDGPTIEEQIEEERRALNSDTLTPMTQEIFEQWKKEEAERRVKEVEKKAAAVKKTKSRGSNVQLSGRDLFTFDPTLFVDDADAAEDDTYVIREDEDEEEEKEKDDAVAAVQDASVFLDDDVELPSDESDDDDE